MEEREYVVLKFGGTSVASRESWQRIATIAQNRLEEGLKPLLVCSALSGISDLLEELLEASLLGEHEKPLTVIHERHLLLAKDLGVTESCLEPQMNELDRLAVGISLVREVTPKLRARVMASGELLSTLLGAAFLTACGLETSWLDVRQVLRSCRVPHASEARATLSAVCDDSPDAEVATRIREIPGDVILTQGFIAQNEAGDTVLLGRGGSDTSATYLAAKIGAKRCEIWTSVPGIFTANPAEVPTAKLLKHLDYDEAQEISSCGAKVLHPRCIPPCRKQKIPLSIHSTDQPSIPGTVISVHDSHRGIGVKAIAKRSGVVLISMDTLGMWQQVGFLAEVFDVFRRHSVSIDLISTSESNVTVSLDAAGTALDRKTLDNLLSELKNHCTTRVIEHCTSISLVGRGIRAILHKLGPALEVFEEQKIHLLSQAASDLNLTFVVDSSEADRLVARLHALLFTDATLGPSWRQVCEEEKEKTSESTQPTEMPQLLPWWRTQSSALLELATKRKTPLYVYNEETLDEAARGLLGLESVERIFYSIKANWHPAVLQKFFELGLGFECVSPGEIEHVLELFPEISRDRILFTPNFAPRREYERGFELGVRVTVDSLYALENWPEIFDGRELFIRLDPGRGRGHHAHVRTAGAQSKFGVTAAHLDRLVELAAKAKVTITGLHAHSGSGIFDPSTWSETAAFLANAAAKFGNQVKVLDLGGGLGIPEKPGQVPLDLKALDGSLKKAATAFPGYKLWLEPGRYLVARAGVLLATVTQIKEKDGTRYIGIDAGMNSLIRPALYGAFHEIVNLSRLDEAPSQVANIVGPICETGDTLGHQRRIAPAQEGDVLLIATAGAYGRVMSSNYNRRPPADEVVLHMR